MLSLKFTFKFLLKTLREYIIKQSTETKKQLLELQKEVDKMKQIHADITGLESRTTKFENGLTKLTNTLTDVIPKKNESGPLNVLQDATSSALTRLPPRALNRMQSKQQSLELQDVGEERLESLDTTSPRVQEQQQRISLTGQSKTPGVIDGNPSDGSSRNA